MMTPDIETRIMPPIARKARSREGDASTDGPDGGHVFMFVENYNIQITTFKYASVSRTYTYLSGTFQIECICATRSLFRGNDTSWRYTVRLKSVAQRSFALLVNDANAIDRQPRNGDHLEQPTKIGFLLGKRATPRTCEAGGM